MPIYQYKALDRAGRDVAGTTEAGSLKQAAEALKRDGLYLKDIISASAGAQSGARSGARVTREELAAVTRQLATLLSAGTTLFEALTLLSSDEKSASSPILYNIKEAISSGTTLAKALEAHPKIFPEMYVRTVEAGEASGTLDAALRRLADYLEARSRILSRIRSALMYPALMVAVGAAVLFFLFLFVLPKITSIFKDTKQALPFITTVLLFLVAIVRGYWFVIIGVGAASFYAVKRALGTASGKAFFDSTLLKLPIVGSLLMKHYCATFSTTLGNLLSSGVPVLNALDMTRRVMNQAVFDTALTKAVRDVTEGMALSVSLKSSGIFPSVLIHMIATGERSGQLDSLLLKAAEAYENEFETAIARAMSLLEPALILVMGVVVAFIVLSILLPIFELNQIVK